MLASTQRSSSLRGLLLAGGLATLLGLCTATLAAAEEPAPFGAGGLAQMLEARIGKGVSLTLRSGATYAGIVGELRTDGVLIRQIVGKEYYDAWVRLDAIDAVEMRRGGV